jgi:hypothetical protein
MPSARSIANLRPWPRGRSGNGPPKQAEPTLRDWQDFDFAGGVVTSLSLVIGKLTTLRDQVAAAGELNAVRDVRFTCEQVIAVIP